MEDNNVPYIAYEGTMARFERIIKRLVVVIILLAIAIFATNALWIYEWNQYEYQTVDINNEDGGNANYMGAGASGVINNAEDSGQK